MPSRNLKRLENGSESVQNNYYWSITDVKKPTYGLKLIFGMQNDSACLLNGTIKWLKVRMRKISDHLIELPNLTALFR